MLTLKRLGKILKKNYRFIIGIVIGILLTGTSVYAANTIYSKNVTYDNSNSKLSSSNVQDALDELYLKMYPSQFYKKLYESAVRDDKSSTYVSSNDGIDFSKISSDTNGKGLYIASEYTDYKYPILYYRGDVNNNNLIFANFCWKIVRTTETGGIKLIYNGVPSNGVCNATGEDTQIGTSAFEDYSLGSPAYVGYMYGTSYEWNQKYMANNSANYYYGSNVTYSNGTYTLTDTISSSSWSSIWNGGLNYNYYTCFGGTSCSNVYFIYQANSDNALYITLNNGKTIEDALSEMLDSNTTSSTIKEKIDNWYYTNILQKGYSSYIEDTVWCDDRSIREISGWSSEGNTRGYLFFGSFERSYHKRKIHLVCQEDEDRFSVDTENGNGDLKYPIGLLSIDEISFSGGSYSTNNTSYYLYTGQDWWTISPGLYSVYNAYVFEISSNGSIQDTVLLNSLGVRPSIALVPGVEISSGTGTANNPYIVG